MIAASEEITFTDGSESQTSISVGRTVEAGRAAAAASIRASMRDRKGGDAASLTSNRPVTTCPNSAPQNDGMVERAVDNTAIASKSKVGESGKGPLKKDLQTCSEVNLCLHAFEAKRDDGLQVRYQARAELEARRL